jgi:glutamate/tyrosine decarboxylase-like PLP-dependent enzyme
MGAGMYLARDWAPLETAFDVDTSYMPAASREHRDPYLHSLQWSRRFIGLKLFTTLAVGGVDAAADRIRRQFEMGDCLKAGLRASGWDLLNDTNLPIACFALADDGGPADEAALRIAERVVASGRAWISTVRIRGRLALRACITSYETGPDDLDALFDELDKARTP